MNNRDNAYHLEDLITNNDGFSDAFSSDEGFSTMSSNNCKKVCSDTGGNDCKGGLCGGGTNNCRSGTNCLLGCGVQ